MLVLSRNCGESIMIGEDVTVTVLCVRGNQVRIGISAPDNIDVYREEIYRKIHDKLEDEDEEDEEDES